MVVLSAFTLVGEKPMQRTPCRPHGMKPALAILLVIAPCFLKNLTLGILFWALASRPYCVH